MATKGVLTPRQARFVEEYLVDLNATQAAIRAGYSVRTARQLAAETLTKPVVSEAIRAAMAVRSARTKITSDRVVHELARVGFSDMRRFTRWGQGGVDLLESATLGEDDARCVAEVSQTTTKDGGTIRFKLHNKVEALTLLGKHLGMFQGEGAEPDEETLPAEEREARVLSIIEAAQRRRKAVAG